jgi:hypothetical protein
MAINPIDIQTLYSSIDKMAKTTTHQQQGMGLSASIHAAEQNKQEIEKNSAVKELSPDGTQTLTVQKDGAGQGEASPDSHERGPGRGSGEQGEEAASYLISDPILGTRIDISG